MLLYNIINILWICFHNITGFRKVGTLASLDFDLERWVSITYGCGAYVIITTRLCVVGTTPLDFDLDRTLM